MDQWLSRTTNGCSDVILNINLGFPGGSDGKASAYNAGDPASTLGREDPREKEMATHSLQYSCLENPMDRGAW